MCATLLAGPIPSFADPAGDAIRAGVVRGVVDADVVSALATEERVRLVVMFASEPGSAASARPDAARERLSRTGYRPGPRLERIPALTGSFDAPALALLLRDPLVLRVSLDPVVRAQLAEAVPLVNLEPLIGGGFEGGGARVAILDTGVDLAHPDLAGAVVAEHCFCDDGMVGPGGCCPNGLAEQGGAGASQDDHGHGTRVAGIVTSAGVHAPLGGAPDAELIAIKVLSSSGSGQGSDFLAGLDWLLANHPEADVVNLSLGFGLYAGDCDTADANTAAFASVIDLLHAAGALSVAGTGNNGSGSGMVAPACIANAVSVGAVWDADVGSQTWFGCNDATTVPDQVACWSNSSPTTDVFAPGALMTSSRLGGTFIARAGTSYATPIVAACAAVLSRAHPDASPDDLATALTRSGVEVVDASNGLIYPRLDCRASHFFLVPLAPTSGRTGLLGLVLLLGVLGAIFQRKRGATAL